MLQGAAADCNSAGATHAWFDSRVAHHPSPKSGAIRAIRACAGTRSPGRERREAATCRKIAGKADSHVEVENESGMSSRFRPPAAPCDAVWKRSAAQPRRIRLFPCLRRRYPLNRRQTSKARSNPDPGNSEGRFLKSRTRPTCSHPRPSHERFGRNLSTSGSVIHDNPALWSPRANASQPSPDEFRLFADRVLDVGASIVGVLLRKRYIFLSGIVFFRLTSDAQLRLWEIAKTASSGLLP